SRAHAATTRSNVTRRSPPIFGGKLQVRVLEEPPRRCDALRGAPMYRDSVVRSNRAWDDASRVGRLRARSFRYCFGVICSITSSRLNLAGFCRIGNSLKLWSHCPTITWDGTRRNAWSTFHLLYSNDSGPRSNGSARRLYICGRRRLVNSRSQTPMPVCSC